MSRQIKIIILFLFTICINYMLNAYENTNLSQNKEHTDIIYFHATVRCEGCLRIEDFIQKSVHYAFEKELFDSSITLKSLDFLQPENEHFQNDYKFNVQSLILSKKINGKEVAWKNLDSIWDLDGDFGKFESYIEREIRNFTAN